MKSEENQVALYNVAYIYEELGDLDNAQKYYWKLLEKNPSNEKAIINLGVVLDKQGKFNEA